MFSILTLKEVLSSVIIGVCSSVIFLTLLWNLKPRFKVSSKICCEPTTLDGVTIQLFYFKVISRSLFFKVYEVKVKAFICKKINNLNGSDNQLNPVEIKFNSLSSMGRFNIRHCFQNLIMGDGNLDSRTDYAAQFFTKHDLRKELADPSASVEFQVIAKHSLTGFSTVKTMRYNHLLRIEDGKFLSGNSFKIVQNQPVIAINTI